MEKGLPSPLKLSPILPKTFLLEAWQVSVAVRQEQHRAKSPVSRSISFPVGRHGRLFPVW
ncbi:hypothetical protein DESPIG_01923 [Desulfovibrio piger ATCC 29098]|uniref:Uncharacterized protein n=1 Tax=Desulfovibrio piger ATCC 29098 TaxID=411464 RepID=B6WV08_9BACT|nr:hypothetical protein DESPIG_01923 [Desulfovibrio piger ATCC 29098]